MQKRFSLDTTRKKPNLSLILFLLSVVASVFTTYYVSTHIIDSDTSSELILAQHWIDTKNPLSADWLYGSELRLFHVQLIYVPLMLLLDDWMLVRYIGSLIMQALYIASFGCLVHAARKSRTFFFYGASLLLLPVSVVYGRIVLYHNHYLPNITISFFLTALSMHFAENVSWRSKKTWTILFLLAGLSFAGGVNSIRQLLITHAPLLLISVILCFLDDTQNKDLHKSSFLKSSNLNFLFCNLYATFFSLLGLKAHGVICDKLRLQLYIQSENNTLNLMDAEYINDILYGFFHQFGFRRNIPIFSASGVLALGGIFTGCYLVFIAANRLREKNHAVGRRTTLLSLFFLAHTAVLLMVFLVTSGEESPYYYPLYLSLCFPWAVPLILINLEELPAGLHVFRVRKLFAVVSLLFLLLSGAVNLLYFLGSDAFPQDYEGLRFQNRDKKYELVQVVTILTEQGYDKGYADHWEANIITEMTNGNMPMIPIDFSRDFTGNQGNLEYQDTLSSYWLREAPCEKPFLILKEDDARGLQISDSLAYCTEVYSGSHHVIYSIDDLDGFTDTLRY